MKLTMRQRAYSSLCSSAAIANYTNSGHDRIVASDRAGLYAVFDGAGSAEASEVARTITYDNLTARSPFGAESRPAFLMRIIQNELTKLSPTSQIIYACTTGTIAHVRTNKKGHTQLDYAAAGDSPLFIYDKEHLTQVTENENLENYYLVNNWLGSHNHRLHQIGSIVLESTDWRAIIVSDGVTDPKRGGLDKNTIQDIAIGSHLEHAAGHIIHAVEPYDDASAVVFGPSN